MSFPTKTASTGREVSAASLHDSQALEPLVQGILKISSRCGPSREPTKLHADNVYDIPNCRQTLRERRIGDRVARCGIETSDRLGHHSWAVQRIIAWLGAYRRLTLRR